MCEFCGTDGACICCGGSAAAGEGVLDRLARLRMELSRLQDAVREIEVEIAKERARRGSRPGDGSDQPSLFDGARQPGLF